MGAIGATIDLSPFPPFRFGKTLMVSTLCNLFAGRRELFKVLRIATGPGQKASADGHRV